MGAGCSCISEQSDIIPVCSCSWSQSTSYYAVATPTANQSSQVVPVKSVTKKSTESEDSDYDLFGEDSESDDDDNLRGVSNVVYRQEWRLHVDLICSPVQSVYSFTSEVLGVGATGPIRIMINRYDCVAVAI